MLRVAIAIAASLALAAAGPASAPAPRCPASAFGVAPGASARSNAAALRAASAACQGGVVAIDVAGTYDVADVVLSGAVSLEIPPDVRLRASDRRSDYGATQREWYAVRFSGCSGCSLFGGGTLDGNARAYVLPGRGDHRKRVRNFADRSCARADECRPRLLGVVRSRGVVVSGVSLVDPIYWSLHVFGSDAVRVSNVSIASDWEVANSDGVDVDGSRDVEVVGSTVAVADDAVCIKASDPAAGPAERVLVRNCTLTSRSCALKVGSESSGNVAHVRVSDVLVPRAHRALGVQLRDGGNLTDLVVENLHVRETRLEADSWWGAGEVVSVTVLPRSFPTEEGRGGEGKAQPRKQARALVGNPIGSDVGNSIRTPSAPSTALPTPALDAPSTALPTPALGAPSTALPTPALGAPSTALPTPALDALSTALPTPALDAPSTAASAPTLDAPSTATSTSTLDAPSTAASAPALDAPSTATSAPTLIGANPPALHEWGVFGLSLTNVTADAAEGGLLFVALHTPPEDEGGRELPRRPAREGARFVADARASARSDAPSPSSSSPPSLWSSLAVIRDVRLSDVRVRFRTLSRHEGGARDLRPSPWGLVRDGRGAGLWIEGHVHLTLDGLALERTDPMRWEWSPSVRLVPEPGPDGTPEGPWADLATCREKQGGAGGWKGCQVLVGEKEKESREEEAAEA